MKVILKSKIKKLGNIGDIVDVRDGYGRNMLIPNGLAIFYTDKNYEVFKIKKAEIEKQNQENKAKAEELRDKINSKDLILIENAGDDGKLYGSINTIKLAQAINSLLNVKSLTKNNVYLKDPLKNVGKYSIIVELHPEVSFEKDVIIARSKEEAAKIKRGEFESKQQGSKKPSDLDASQSVAKSESSNSSNKVEEKETAKELKADKGSEKGSNQ